MGQFIIGLRRVVRVTSEEVTVQTACLGAIHADTHPAIHLSMDTPSFIKPILFMAGSFGGQRHAPQTESLLSVWLVLLLLLPLLYFVVLSAPRAGLSGAGLTDFADDVADLVASSTAAEGGKSGGLNELFGKHKLSQRYGADLAMQQQAQVSERSCNCITHVLGEHKAVLRLVLVIDEHQTHAAVNVSRLWQ